jgi:hypothetical protein
MSYFLLYVSSSSGSTSKERFDQLGIVLNQDTVGPYLGLLGPDLWLELLDWLSPQSEDPYSAEGYREVVHRFNSLTRTCSELWKLSFLPCVKDQWGVQVLRVWQQDPVPKLDRLREVWLQQLVYRLEEVMRGNLYLRSRSN